MIQVFTTGSIGIPERYLRVCDTEEVRTVMQYNKEIGSGYSKDKELKFMGKIPTEIYWNPKFRHIFHNPDPIEGKRLRSLFVKRFSGLGLRDR